MSEGVSFEEQGVIQRRFNDEQPTGMAAEIINLGLAKNTVGANRVLIVIAFLVIVGAAAFFLLLGRAPSMKVPPGSTLINTPGQPPRLERPAR
jgi:hypothetical protein